MRLGLIKEDVVLEQNEAFILCDSNGTEQIRLISIIDNGGSALAYKAIRNKNGSSSVCIVKEYYPAQKEDIYQKLVKIQEEKGLKDQALEICRKGAEELKDSKQLRILYMRMQCSDSDISREICAQTIKEYLNQIPEIKEETEFQKLAQEYGIVIEGENVWVGR